MDGGWGKGDGGKEWTKQKASRENPERINHGREGEFL